MKTFHECCDAIIAWVDHSPVGGRKMQEVNDLANEGRLQPDAANWAEATDLVKVLCRRLRLGIEPWRTNEGAEVRQSLTSIARSRPRALTGGQ